MAGTGVYKVERAGLGEQQSTPDSRRRQCNVLIHQPQQSMAAVQVESWQQRELRWDSVGNCPEMTQEVTHGHLMMVTGSPHRHRHSVFARLYRTSAGQMLVLWPDKLHAPPIGCVTLKDTFVTSDESRSTITLRGHNDDDLPLTLICLTPDDYQRWKRAFTTRTATAGGGNKRKKFITNVVRLPMLIEEEL